MWSGTGQPLFPAIQFEDGGSYREESQNMARTIRERRLNEKELRSAPRRRVLASRRPTAAKRSSEMRV